MHATDETPPLTLTADANDLVARARAFTVTTADDYQVVAGFLVGLKALRAKIAETFDEHIRRAFVAHRALVQEKRDAEAAVVEAERIAKVLLVQWDAEQQRAADAARAALEAARTAERVTLEEYAEIADVIGEQQRADEFRIEAAMIAPPLVAPATPKVAGVALRETWTARVVDLGALVKAAANHPPYLALLKVDMPRLHAQARSLRARLDIPGVEAVCSKTVAASARPSDHGEP